ncbi:MAG: hypothetical protein CM15mP117_17430 [Alphaproteobacteria bacterium]|nr:MAG: hypothetical protein CM15mP117_17430 [Alphaproteobacteria bacterium]
MSKPPTSILIYGICETPSILWNAHCLNPQTSNINRQYICLNDESLTLRIGSKGWLEFKPEQLLQFQSNTDLNAYTKEMLLSKVNTFNRPIKNALVSYFTWIENECLKFSEGKLSSKTDRLFAKADQLFYSAFLPLPHPKIVISNEDGKFQGVANFDLSFCISGKVYLFTFSDGQFIRKTELKFRENYLKIMINLYLKIYQNQYIVMNLI